MKSLGISRYALAIGASSVFLAGCGSLQSPVGYPDTPFKHVERANGGYELLYDFQAKPDGQNPEVRLIPFGADLYGSTPVGGKGCGGKGCGIVFSVTKTGKETLLHHFNGVPDGAHPMAELAVANRKLYGTTDLGGASCRSGALKSGCGTVFELDPSGAERVVYRFKDIPDGAYPQGPLTPVNGTLYGTTASGGTKCGGLHGGCGTVYSVDPSGKEQVLYRFKGTPDGAEPTGNLLLFNGVLYGTTYKGGATTRGTIFSVTLSGVEQVISSFSATGLSNYYPSGLVVVDGVLYGEAYGGPHGGGVVYSMTTSGDEGIVYAFSNPHERNGYTPHGRLIGVNGVLYGTTVAGGGGGGSGFGTVSH